MRNTSITTPSESKRTVHRVSVACSQCRSRHMKCDAKFPECSRCRLEKKQCTYPKSRRGGKRRRTKSPEIQHESVIDSESMSLSPTQLSYTTPLQLAPETTLPASTSSASENLLDLYYSYFHFAQSCVLPKQLLLDRLEKDPLSLEALILTMRYIGSLFDSSVSSEFLEQEVRRVLAPIRNRESCLNGYHVQALLLFSIALYGGNKIENAIALLDETIECALELGMQFEEFAIQQGEGDLVLEESWRRTWWQIYVTDANIAGGTHTFPSKSSGVKTTTLLPCEDINYESGVIPQPRTIYEYDMREFLTMDRSTEFSSFAELIGLTRSLNRVLSAREVGNANAARIICSETDTAISAWCSLLPSSKRNIVKSDGTVDEYLFKANFLIHTYIIDVHRELSDLAYSPIESVARCAPPPPVTGSKDIPLKNTQPHTLRALLSIEKLNGLLTIVTCLATRTPFIICMIATTTIAHLSACRYLFRDRKLQMEREKIRLSMGALKALSEYWPLGQRTYNEVGIIAREILSLADTDISPWNAGHKNSLPVWYPDLFAHTGESFEVSEICNDVFMGFLGHD